MKKLTFVIFVLGLVAGLLLMLLLRPLFEPHTLSWQKTNLTVEHAADIPQGVGLLNSSSQQLTRTAAIQKNNTANETDDREKIFSINMKTGGIRSIPKVNATLRITSNGGKEYSGSLRTIQGNNTLTDQLIPKGTYNAILELADAPVQKIQFNELVINGSADIRMGSVNETGFTNSFAIDPTGINFSSAAVTAIARGNTLFKCADWNFTAETCPSGKWKKVRQLAAGQPYNFTLTQNDPGYGESNATIDLLDKNEYLIQTNQTLLANNSGRLDVQLNISGTDNVRTLIVYGYNESAGIKELKLDYNITNASFIGSYALDPTNISFANASVTAIARGNTLFKCADWNFTAETCPSGKWKKVRQLAAGQPYNFTLTQNDPGYGESNATIDLLDKNEYLIQTNQTVLANRSGLLDIQINLTQTQNITGIKNITVFAHNESNSSRELHIETNLSSGSYLNTFSIDPTNISFRNASITFTASGSRLFKCTNWDAASQTCPGNNWTLWKTDLVPGQLYTFILTPGDPGLAESGGLFFEGWENGSISSNWTNSSIWQVSSSNPRTGTKHLRAQSASPEATLYSNISTVGYENIHISFDLALDDLDSGEYFAADWYNGSSWLTIYNLSNELDYSFRNFTLPSSANNLGQFAVRFRCKSSSGGEKCDLDNININGSLIPVNITNLIEESRTNGSITIEWDTNESMGSPGKTNASIRYGTTKALNLTQINTTLDFNHSFTITNLANNTIYFYNLTSCRSDNTCATVGEYNFTTKQNTLITLSSSPSAAVSYPTQTNTSCIANNNEVNLTLYRDGILVTNPNNLSLGAAIYQYTCNASASQNFYLANASLSINITKAAGRTNLTLGNTPTNVTVESHTPLLINATRLSGEVVIELLLDGSVINASTSSALSTLTYSSLGNHTFLARLNTSQNYTAHNLTYNLSVIDTTPPNPGTLTEPTDPSPYIKSAQYQFNSSWSDRIAISSVWLEFNNVNYTATLTNNYNITLHDLATGTYSYRWHSSDTSGNRNQTAAYTFTLSKASGSLNLTLGGTTSNATLEAGSTTTANATRLSGESSVELIVDGSVINTSTSSALSTLTYSSLGNHTFLARLNTSQNYTAHNLTYNLSVIDTTPPNPGTLTEPQDPSNYSASADYIFNATITDIVGINGVWLEFNGTNKTATLSNNYNTTVRALAVGTYNYTWHANDTRGNRNSTPIKNFTVQPTLSRLNLTLNGSATNITIPTYTTFTINASLLAGEQPLELIVDGIVVNQSRNISYSRDYISAGNHTLLARYNSSQNYSNSSASLNLSVFSTDVCGDGSCTGAEDGNNCPSDCAPRSGGRSSGGGGGGSSSGGSTAKPCTEDWSCDDWSQCTDSTQSRTCTDKNACGAKQNKPDESRECEPQPQAPPSSQEPNRSESSSSAELLEECIGENCTNTAATEIITKAINTNPFTGAAIVARVREIMRNQIDHPSSSRALFAIFFILLFIPLTYLGIRWYGRSTTRTKVWRCRKCNIDLQTKQGYAEHRATHPLKLNLKQKLAACTAVIVSSHTYLKKKLIRTRFPCTLCGKAFMSRTNLKEHTYTHHKRPPHQVVLPSSGLHQLEAIAPVKLKPHMSVKHSTHMTNPAETTKTHINTEKIQPSDAKNDLGALERAGFIVRGVTIFKNKNEEPKVQKYSPEPMSRNEQKKKRETERLTTLLRNYGLAVKRRLSFLPFQRRDTDITYNPAGQYLNDINTENIKKKAHSFTTGKLSSVAETFSILGELTSTSARYIASQSSSIFHSVRVKAPPKARDVTSKLIKRSIEVRDTLREEIRKKRTKGLLRTVSQPIRSIKRKQMLRELKEVYDAGSQDPRRRFD